MHPASSSSSAPSAAADAARQRASFFRQSGWLMIANIASGVLMWAVHLLNKAIPPGEYGSFGALLAVVMLLPTIPLQMVLAQQTAKAIAQGREREVAGVIHAVWLVITLGWVVGAAFVLRYQQAILDHWKMTSPVGLWITLAIVLFSFWLPMFWGVLQGQQNFLWLGWSMLANGIGRLTVAAVAVLALHAYASGMMAGVLLGIMIGVGIAAGQTRRLWWLRAQAFDGRALVRQVLPLALGFLGFQILFTGDTILVKAWFSQTDADFYVSAGTLSRALMWLVLPLASVMFPRIVHSAARAEPSDLMGKVLLATAVLAVVGALGLSLLGPWVVRFVYQPEFVAVASSLLPWYAAAMVPLAVANVLLNNLLARPAASLVPAICIFALAIGYLVALTRFHDQLVTVLQVLGVFNLALLAVCAWFTWRQRQARPSATSLPG
ncbi:MAG: Polysaccharide biosynthesis protein [Verrucomicrobia bacterium ADurb.Bin118]|nr:MAG: Polysaccharide biosynthesis protein [Verrucomicrobia bacterium ADurb.Bin118]